MDDPPLSTANYSGVVELRSRLPHVPETVITHFLSKYGNVDECYEKLKDHMTDEYARSFTLPSRPTPTNVNGGATTNDSTPPHRHLQRLPTYGPGTPWPSDYGAYGNTPSGPPPSLPAMSHHNREPPYPISYANYPNATMSLTPISPRTHHRINETDTLDLLAAQRKQVEHVNQVRDTYVHELSLLRGAIDNKKQELTRLRIEVSEGPTQMDIGTVQDVISTLQYDIQSIQNKIQVEKTQVEMKGKLDVYTEEGVRWNCQHCKFLNHPLMTRCEYCDRPKR